MVNCWNPAAEKKEKEWEKAKKRKAKKEVKIKTVDISVIICEAIRRIYNKESMGFLFKDIALDD